MPKYNVKLVKKELIAAETMAFSFEKPEGFDFRAGQFCDITLFDPPETDAEGNIRGFSLVDAPFEDEVVVATRMRDTAFKRVLRELPLGTVVELDAAYGDFTLHKTTTTPAVFIIGGIGITPVRSIIAQATHDAVAQDITLLHVNRTAAESAFAADFEGLARENDRFTFVPVMTQASPTEWFGERGHVTTEMLAKYVPDLAAPIYYMSGPAGMVMATRQLLLESGANEDNIRTEEFSGY